MINHAWLLILITFMIINSLSGRTVKHDITWNGNWAFGCDFKGNDLSNVQIPGEQCGGKCDNTLGCTHFTWTTYNGGTCWMKFGVVSKTNAFSVGDQTSLCGISDWKLVWEDTFDWNGRVDTRKWDFDVGNGGWGKVFAMT